MNDSVADSAVENWNIGGWPLGLTLGLTNEVIVADAYKVSDNHMIRILVFDAFHGN